MKKFLVVLTMLLIASGALYYMYQNEQKKEAARRREVVEAPGAYQGISIDGKDVSGRSWDDVRAEILAEQTAVLSQKVNIHIGEALYSPTLAELGLSGNADAILQEAASLAKSGTDEERYAEIESLRKNGKAYQIAYTADPAKLEAYVQSIESGYGHEAEEAKIEFHDGKFTVVEGKPGLRLNRDRLMADIRAKLDAHEGGDVTADAEVVSPGGRNELLSRINGVIGTYTSNLGRGTAGRNENIRLSASRISNRVIWPGEEISFNREMGDITTANGYKMASTIQGGRYIDSLGGGLCQTSTTLYNALVRSDVEILERHPHSIPAPYVPVGEDGAVWVGAKDLRFRNNWDFPIVIQSAIHNNQITFTIYGDTHEKNYAVEMYTVITEKIPPGEVIRDNPELPVGQKKVVQAGRPGYRAQSYKVYKQNGKVLREVPYQKSYYPKQDAVVEVGSKQGAPEAQPPKETVDLFQ